MALQLDGTEWLGVEPLGPPVTFERDMGLVGLATEDRGIRYPVAIDNDYKIWNAFANRAWPALYFIDAHGKVRDRHFGEGRYERSERLIQEMLGLDRELVSVSGLGVEADWDHLLTPESYLGYARSERFSSAGPVSFDETHAYAIPDGLPLNHWALAGEWTVRAENVTLNRAGGSIAFRFHSCDAHVSAERARVRRHLG